MTKRARAWPVIEMIYGPDAHQVWPDKSAPLGQAAADITAWLQTQRVHWTVRSYPKGASYYEVTAWARQQGLKRLDWDFIPKQQIWFRDPQVAMIWDLSGLQDKTTD